MNADQYKNSIKQIVDSTNNELLLMHWEKQLQWDIGHVNEIKLSDQEWNLVEEGLTDYANGDVISLEEFINKR
ncbi:MAG TPA: hypothetical protein VIM07_05920 [Chitinophagaceae bacterium]